MPGQTITKLAKLFTSITLLCLKEKQFEKINNKGKASKRILTIFQELRL